MNTATLPAGVDPDTAAPPPPTTKPGAKELSLIMIGHGLTHWYPATFYLLLPLIGKELGLSYSQIGLVMTCQYVAGALSNMPGGMLADMYSRKSHLMALSLFWVGVPYLLMSFTHHYWMVLCCVALVGIGNNLWHPTAIPTLGRMFPERKGLVLSLHGMGGNVGDALAPLAIGALLGYFSWRQLVVINVLPGAVMSGFILYFLGALAFAPKHTAPAGSNGHGAKRAAFVSYVQGFRELVRTPGLFMLTISSSFRSMTQGTLLTFLPLYLANEMHYKVQWVGASMAALQVAGFIASPIAGHLSDRVGHRRVLMSTMAMTAVVLIGVIFAAHSPYFVFGIAVLGFFLYAARPVLQAWLLDVTPKGMGGTTIGMLFGMQALGQAAGPIIGGVVADRWGLIAAFYVLAATIVIANLFVIAVPAGDTKADA